MRIAIAGIGGVGGYYGGQLARYYDPGGDVAVAFIARGRHLAAIRKRGLSPGIVRHVGGSCRLFFGPEHGDIPSFTKIEQMLKNAGIKAELRENIDEIVWEKYIFISPLASVTALLGEPFGAVMEKKASRELAEGLIKEVERIARAKTVKMAEDIVELTLENVNSFPYETKSSMQVDCENGKQAEIEAFTGYIVRSGEELQVDVPLHRMVYGKLKARCP